MISIWRFWILIFQNKFLFSTALIFLFLSFTLAPISAQALETLSFKEAKNYKERKAISFVKKTFQTPDIKYVLSAIDLNNDGLNEYIIKPASCSPNTFCQHHIVAFMKEQLISLLSIKAQKIIIKDIHHYGVRDLMVYSSPMNDFEKSKYQWNPFSYIYEQKDGFKTR